MRPSLRAAVALCAALGTARTAHAQTCEVTGTQVELGGVSIGAAPAIARSVDVRVALGPRRASPSTRVTITAPVAADVDAASEFVTVGPGPGGIAIAGVLQAMPSTFHGERAWMDAAGPRVDLSTWGLELRGIAAPCASLAVRGSPDAPRTPSTVIPAANALVAMRGRTLTLAAGPEAAPTLTLAARGTTRVAFARLDTRGQLVLVERRWSDGSFIRGWAPRRALRDLPPAQAPYEPRAIALDRIDLDEGICIDRAGSWVGPAVTRSLSIPLRAQPSATAAQLATITTRDSIVVEVSADRRWASLRQAPGLRISCGPAHLWIDVSALDLGVLRGAEITLRGAAPGTRADSPPVVEAVTPGSQFARAGLRAGDRITSLASPLGMRIDPATTPLLEIREALGRTGSPVRVLRGTSEVRLTVP